MCVFPEPGYYEDGAFGIRIENVVLVKGVDTKYNFDGKRYLTMEPVTMVTALSFPYPLRFMCFTPTTGTDPDKDDRALHAHS